MCIKASVNIMQTSGEKFTLRSPPLATTTIYNLVIRPLIPVHDKWELPVAQLQCSLCEGSLLLSEHGGNTGSVQNAGHVTSLSSYDCKITVYQCTLTHALRLKRPKPLIGTDFLAAVSVCLIELYCIVAQHTHTKRPLIKPLIQYQLCWPWK